ncbi:translocation/assembly module TamB domain-containing protein [Candidatus Poribacteria bacterium]
MKKKILIGLCASILVLLIGAYIFMRSSFFTDRVRLIVESTLEKRLEREVSVGKVSGNIFGNISITGVSIAKDEEISDGKFLDIGQLKARYSLLSLLRWRFVIKSIRIIRPRVWLERSAEGKLNIPELAATEDKDKKEEKSSRFSVLVSNIEILSGTVMFDDKQNSIRSAIIGLNGNLRGTGSITNYSGEVRAQSMNISVREVSKTISDIKASFETSAEGITVSDFQLYLGKSHLSASAEVSTGDAAQKVYAEIQSRLFLEDIKEFVATPAPRLGGIAEIDGVVSGTIPDIGGQCVISIPAMKVNDLEARNVDAEVEFTQSSINLTYLSIDLSEGGVRLSGGAQLDDGKLSKYNAELKMENLDIGGIMIGLNEIDIPVSGYLSGDVSIDGTEPRPGKMNLDGRLSMLDAQWENSEATTIPIGKVEAALSVKGESIALDISRGKAHAELKGTLGDDAGLGLQTEIDIPDAGEITSLVTSVPPIMGKVHISAETSMKIAHPGFRASMGLPPVDSHLSVTQAIADLRGHVKLDMPDLRLLMGDDQEEVQIGFLTGGIDLVDDHIKINEILLQLNKSKSLLTGNVHLKENSKHEIDATLTLDSFLVEDYVPLIGGPSQVSDLRISGGQANGKLEVSGDIEVLNGSGDISVTDLSIVGRDIELISLPIEIESNVLSVPELIISSLGERITASCRFTPSGEYDLKVDSSLIELSRLSPDVPPVSGTAQLNLSGSGNIGSPSLKGRLDLQNLGYEGESFGDGNITFTLKDDKAHADISLSDGSFIASVDSYTQHPFPFSAIVQLGNINLEPALNLAGLGEKIDLHITGSIDVDGEAANPINSSVNAMLQTMLLNVQGYRWRNDEATELRFSNGEFTMDSLRMKGAGGVLSVNAGFDTAGAIDLNANVKSFDLAIASKFLEAPETFTGKLDCELNVDGEISAPSMEAKLDASEVVYEQFNMDRMSALVSYRNGSMRIEESTLEAFGGETKLKAEMPIELDLRNPPTRDQLLDNSIYAFLDVQDLDLSFIPSVAPEVSDAVGTLDDVHLELTGPIKQPKIVGSFRLRDAYFQSSSLPIPVKDVNGVLSLASIEHIHEPETGEATRSMEYEASAKLDWRMDEGEYDAQFTIADTGSWALNTWHQMLGIHSPASEGSQPSFQLGLEIGNGQLGTFLKAVPEAKIPPIDGSFSGTANLSGEIGTWVNEQIDLLTVMSAPLNGDVVINSLNLSIDEHKINNSGEIKISLTNGDLEVSSFGLTVLSPSANSASTSNVPSVRRSFAVGSGRLSADETFEMAISGERLHPGLFSSLLDLPGLESGELGFDVNATGRLGSPAIELSVTARDLELPVPAVNGETKIDTFECEANYKDEVFDIKDLYVDSFGNRLDVSGTVPVRLSLVPVVVEPLDQDMDVRFTMNNFDLSFLNHITDRVKAVRGAINADAEMRGNLEAPLLTGSFQLSDASGQLMVNGTKLAQGEAPGEPQPLDIENAKMDIDIKDGEMITGNMSFEIGAGWYEAHGELEISQQLKPQKFDFTFAASPAVIDPFIKLVDPDRTSLISGEIMASGDLEGDVRDFQDKPILDILRSISGKIEIPAGGVKVDAAKHRITNPNKIDAKLENGIINLDSLKLIDETGTGGRSSSIAAFGSWDIDGDKSFNATLNLDMGLVSELIDREGFMSGWLGLKLVAREDKVEIFWPPATATDTEKFTIGLAAIDRFEGKLTYRDQVVTVEKDTPILISSGRNRIFFSGNIPMTGEDMDLRLDGRLDDMSILSFLNKDITESSGQGAIAATITGDMRKVIAKEEPFQFVGSCSFSDLDVNFYESNMSFEDLKADVGFHFGRPDPTKGFIDIRNFRGKMNDGDFYLNTNRSSRSGAEIIWQKETGYRIGELEGISVMMENCLLMQPLVFSITFGGELILEGRFDAPIITGNITISKGEYTESLDSFVQRLFSSRAVGFKAFLDYPLVQDLELNVSVQVPGSMFMSNSIVIAEAEAFAKITGSLAKPLVSARGQILEGTLSYFEQDFEIKEGKVTNESEIDPKYKIKAETEITNTEDLGLDALQGSTLTITIELEGSLSSPLPPKFSASGGGVTREQQELSDTDIISILTLGATPKAFLDKGLTGSSPLLMEPATRLIEKRAERMLNLKEFELQLDLNSAKETRLVVTKEVMKQIQISVLLDVGYRGEQWIGLQHEVGRHFAVEGKVNMGSTEASSNWSFDLKVKRDFE